MVDKTKLHLGQEVLVGEVKEVGLVVKSGVIDGLTQTFACVRLENGQFMMCGYEIIFIGDITTEKEVDHV